jgi:hypothetical protein
MLSLWPPSNQQMKPAEPPASTQPRSMAERSSGTNPTRWKRSHAYLQ